MDGATLTIIGVNGLGWAVMAGMGWNLLHTIKSRQEELIELVREQNARVDKLEKWRSRQEGKREGFSKAREKYER